MLPGLFVGRFQPFHLGHLDAVKQAFEKEKYLLIVIGSAEDDFTLTEPFTAGERYQMIEASLLSLMTRNHFAIVPIRNIHHYGLWVSHVESLLPPFGTVYTGSPLVRRLFLESQKYKVATIKKRLPITATDIRKRMIEGKKWGHLVPKPCIELLKQWRAILRLQEISQQ